MNRYRATGCCSVFVHLEQHPCESIYEYFERFQGYLEDFPNHGLQLHELLRHFLNGMIMKEHHILDTMAGGSIWDRTPTEAWYLIQDRAAETRPYMEYVKFSREEKARQEAEAVYQRMMAEYYKECEEFSKAKHEAKSAPEPAQFSVDDEEVPLLIEERADEDIVDVELHVVPTMCKEDVPAEEWISPPCSDRILEQNLVITRNPIISPISKMFLSYSVQNGKSKEARRDNQVWGLLEKTEIHVPMVRTPKIMLTPDQVFDELHLNWKKRKKGKFIHLDVEFSMFSLHVQKNRSSFGWKPGWNAWKNAPHKVTKENQRFWTVEGNSFHQRNCPNLGIRKFDGIHPWAPNI